MTDEPPPPRAARPVRLLAATALAVIIADLASKFLVVEILELPAVRRLEILPPYLVFVYAENRGVNFGLLGSADLRWLLTGLAVTVSIGLAWWSLRRGTAPLLLGAGLVIGGALGNAWDRVRYGAVIDFLNMSCCGINNPFAFNIADVAIVFGALLIAWKA